MIISQHPGEGRGAHGAILDKRALIVLQNGRIIHARHGDREGATGLQAAVAGYVAKARLGGLALGQPLAVWSVGQEGVGAIGAHRQGAIAVGEHGSSFHQWSHLGRVAKAADLHHLEGGCLGIAVVGQQPCGRWHGEVLVLHCSGLVGLQAWGVVDGADHKA